MGSPQQKYFPLTGGVDMVTSPIKIDPGKMIACSNYEQGILGGYTRVQGFERTDGRTLPSVASYWILNFDAGNIALVPDQRLMGQTSGAVAKILSVVLQTGSYAGGDAAGHIVLGELSGVFINNEVISITDPDPGFSPGFSGGFN